MNVTRPKQSGLVSVVIPTRDREESVSRLVRSLKGSTYKDLEILVVDDSPENPLSSKGPLFHDIQVMRNPCRKQLSASRNIGALASKGEFVFFLDDDNVIDADCISELLNALVRNQKIAVAAPIMYFLRDPRRIWWAGTVRGKTFGTTKYVGSGSLDLGQFNRQTIETADCPNAFMVRSKILRRVGLFDSGSFPSTYSEADFCERIRALGYNVVMVPQAKVWHDTPFKAGFGKLLNLMFRDSQRAFNLMQGSVMFRRKYAGRHALCMYLGLYLPLYLLGYCLSTLASNASLENKIATVTAYFGGVASGLQYSLIR